MSFTLLEKDLRILQICRAARVTQFKRACRVRAKHPKKISLSTLSLLRNLIDDADAEIAAFRQNYLR